MPVVQGTERMPKLNKPALLLLPDASFYLVCGTAGATKGGGVDFAYRSIICALLSRCARGMGRRFIRLSFGQGHRRGLRSGRHAKAEQHQTNQDTGSMFHGRITNENLKTLTMSRIKVSFVMINIYW